MISNRYDVVVVPFPFTERRAHKRRPALALSSQAFNASSGHTVLAMITSADNPSWPMDVEIDAGAAGLPKPSRLRMKLFTLDNRLVERSVGRLSLPDLRRVERTIRALFFQA